jgi:hypothetical protein
MREKRYTRRQPMRHSAWVAITPEQRFGCTVADISETGARIEVNDSAKVPDSFVLMLSSNGAARRFCRMVWRKPHQVGVKFEKSFAEAAKPATSADAAAVPAEREEPVTAA